MGNLKQWYIDNLEGNILVRDDGNEWNARPATEWKGDDTHVDQKLFEYRGKGGSIHVADIKKLMVRIEAVRNGVEPYSPFSIRLGLDNLIKKWER